MRKMKMIKMKMIKMVKTMLIGMTMAVAMAGSAFAMTPQELKEAHTAEYQADTKSVYGPKLTQEQLDEVAGITAAFTTAQIQEHMTEEEKIRAIHTYLYQNITYADDWIQNSANTAYGALVKHTAQCSGYARAFKALCDAAGIECYYVHADQNAVNPNHQWNIVKLGEQYYHMDAQVNCSDGGADTVYLTATHPCTYAVQAYPQIAAEDAAVTRYYWDGPYAKPAAQEEKRAEAVEFPGQKNIWIDFVSEAAGYKGVVDYGICQAYVLPDDVESILVMEESPYDESIHDLQMALIPCYGQKTRELGDLYVALEDHVLTNFQDLHKGQKASLDPLGLGRSGPEIAEYCRANDIFFQMIIFDGCTYRAFEKEHGYVTARNLEADIPGMTVFLTY